MPIGVLSQTRVVCANNLNGRSESEQRGAENDAFSACFLVGMDVAMVHVKGTNDDRDEFDKRILLYMPELAWHQKV